MPSNSEVAIRQVGYTHPDVLSLADEVQAYYQSIYGEPDGSPMADDEFAAPQGAFFAGYLDDRPVTIGGWRLHDPIPGYPAKRPAEIKRMYVVAAARRRGLARSMLTHLELTAAERGADALILETGRIQPDAVALYRAAGFVDIPSFGYYAGEALAVHLGKRI